MTPIFFEFQGQPSKNKVKSHLARQTHMAHFDTIFTVHTVTHTPIVQTLQCATAHSFPRNILSSRQYKNNDLALCLATPTTTESEVDEAKQSVLRTRYWLERTRFDERVRERYMRIQLILRRRNRAAIPPQRPEAP
jgi:hypothetical protein